MAQNEIIERDAAGKVLRVRFIPPGPVETPQLMREMVDSYAQAVDGERERLIVVPLAILDFLCIHPFSDGNGRTGRLLTLQLLYQADYEVGRYISLERIIEESKETYYEALERSSSALASGAARCASVAPLLLGNASARIHRVRRTRGDRPAGSRRQDRCRGASHRAPDRIVLDLGHRS